MNKKEFHKILMKPDSKCDGFEIHLKRCWDNNRAKSIFSLTGIDFSNILGEEISFMNIKNPNNSYSLSCEDGMIIIEPILNKPDILAMTGQRMSKGNLFTLLNKL